MAKKATKIKVVTGSGKKKAQPKNKKKFLWFSVLAVYVLVNIGVVGLYAYQNYQANQTKASAAGWTRLGVWNEKGTYIDNFSSTTVSACRIPEKGGTYGVKMLVVRPSGPTFYTAEYARLQVVQRKTANVSSWWGGTMQVHLMKGNKSDDYLAGSVYFKTAGWRGFLTLPDPARKGTNTLVKDLVKC